MILGFVAILPYKLCVPRESGDDPVKNHFQALGRLVFPAKAGMIPTKKLLDGTMTCVPRESGDDPKVRFVHVKCGGCSPRKRG